VGHLLVLVKAQILVLAELEVGPILVDFLLNAIDHLLHLLGLLVSLDETPRTKGLGVAIVFRAVLDDVVDGGDFRAGPVLELVDSVGVPARDGFAIDMLISRGIHTEGGFMIDARLHHGIFERHDGNGWEASGPVFAGS
jgi:hypothetical protein